MQALALDRPGPVNTNWRPGPVNTNWGSGSVNTNWRPGPVNTNCGPGPAARVKARAGVPAEGRRTGNTNTRFEIFYKPEQLKYYVVQFNSKAELFEGALSEAAVLRCHSN